MNKDKHWLSNEITNLAGSAFFREENELVVNVIELRKLVEQLDEQEITEEHAWKVIERANHYHIAPADVWKYKEVIQKGLTLSGISKPKLPAIPQFVADYIESEKNLGVEFAGIMLDFYNFKIVENVNNYMNENIEMFARAWLSKEGYTIEKEKLYYMKLKEDLAEQMLLTRHKYLNVLIGKRGQAYTFDDKMGYSSYFKTKLTKEEVEIWKNKLNELEFDIVEVTE